jgi:predicted outer membrane protein
MTKEADMFKLPKMQSIALGLTLLLSVGIGLAAESKTSNTKLSSADSEFVKEAFQGGAMEVQLGKLAQDKAINEKVKQFGKRMEQDHSKANGELKKIAADKGIQLSAELDKTLATPCHRYELESRPIQSLNAGRDGQANSLWRFCAQCNR